jgi:hypothetical protein
MPHAAGMAGQAEYQELAEALADMWDELDQSRHLTRFLDERPHQGIAQRVPADERDAHSTTVTDVGLRQIH